MRLGAVGAPGDSGSPDARLVGMSEPGQPGRVKRVQGRPPPWSRGRPDPDGVEELLEADAEVVRRDRQADVPEVAHERRDVVAADQAGRDRADGHLQPMWAWSCKDAVQA